MTKQVFIRYEEKYLITDKQKKQLLSKIKNYITYDDYCNNDSEYSVYNIYFDTENDDIIRESLQKPVFKEKLRLRCYDIPKENKNPVFLEMKSKYRGLINKRRVTITYGEVKDYFNFHQIPLFDIDSKSWQIMKEIDNYCKLKPIKPNYSISYHRLALQDKSSGMIRLTFDHDILYKKVSFDSFDYTGNRLFDKDLWLFEIKSPQNYPLWLVSALTELNIRDISFSKYGKAYQNERTGA